MNPPKILIDKIEFKGAQRTNNFLLENEFIGAQKCENFQQLHASLLQSTRRLESFGIFSSVVTIMKVNPNYQGDKLPIHIVVEVKEKKIPFLKVIYLRLRL